MRTGRHLSTLLGGTLSLALVLGGCSPLGSDSHDAAIPEEKLPALVLQPRDLGRVFTRFDEGPLAIADSARGERSDPLRFGRKGGWKARYRRPGSAATAGPLVVESRVDLFDDSSGAEQEFDAYLDELEGQAAQRSNAGPVEVDSLGDAAVASSQGVEAGQDSARFFTVVWRDANVTASVVANGLGRLQLADAIELAHAQQQRIAAAAPS